MEYNPISGSLVPGKDDLENYHPFNNYYKNGGVKEEIQKVKENE